MTRTKKKTIYKNMVLYALLALLFLFFVFPFFVMITRSVMSDDEILRLAKIFPTEITFEPYARMFNTKMLYWLRNTLIIAVLNAAGAAFSASLCAYGFTKMKFKGQSMWFAVTLATMMLPAISMQIPLYVLFTKLHWIGTWYPMIIPAFFGGGAINIFLMRQFMKGIPDQLCEAARIDGAGRLLIYFRIVLPLCLPIVLYVAVTMFIGSWNDFMTPLMYLGVFESRYTLSLALYNISNPNLPGASFPNEQMAAGIFMMLPCVVLFAFFQRQLIEGVTLTGIKG